MENGEWRERAPLKKHERFCGYRMETELLAPQSRARASDERYCVRKLLKVVLVALRSCE